MEARVKLRGHPVHQMLIVLPLGLLTGALIFDVLHLLTGGAHFALVSYWLIPAGIAGGLLAAVFGFLDWTKIPADTRAKKVGVGHARANVTALVIFAVSWWLRRDNPVEPGTIPTVLVLLGGGLAMVSGWLGGELVNRHGVGVDDDA